MKCCAHCFGDLYLEREVIPSCSDERGACPHCHTRNVDLVEPSELKEYFEPVLGIYTLAEDGKLLVEWLMEDWAMFENEHIDLANAKDLLADVMDDGELVRKKFVPLDSSETSTLQQWTSLKAELKHQNRFFPESSLDVDRIRELLPYLRLEVGEITREWYRGRIQTDQRVYPADKMGAPPKQRAAHGRANPAGIPYLY